MSLGLEVVTVYEVRQSAWKGAHRKALTQVYKDARAGRFQILLCWALDRLSREGVAATLEIINRLAQYKVKVWSLHESWTQVEGPLQELLLSIVAWIARMESERRSERTKAGLERAKAAGKRLGRPRVSERPEFEQRFTKVVERIGPGGLSRRQDRLEWLGAGFDPEAFDFEQVNHQLARLRYSSRYG